MCKIIIMENKYNIKSISLYASFVKFIKRDNLQCRKDILWKYMYNKNETTSKHISKRLLYLRINHNK